MIVELLQSVEVPGVDRLVAGAVVHSGDRVLALRRSDEDDFLPGVEELPSGGCEPGETLLQGLRRELAEEIGWTGLLDLDPRFVATFDYRDGKDRLARQFTFALAAGEARVRLSSEHSSWRWLSWSRLDDSDLTPQSKRMVTEWRAYASDAVAGQSV